MQVPKQIPVRRQTWPSHLLRNYLTDSNETCKLCSVSPDCLVVEVQKSRQTLSFGSRLGTSWNFPLTGLLSRLHQKRRSDFFRSWSECFPQCLVVQVPKKSDLSKNMAAVGHLWFFLLLHLLRNYSLVPNIESYPKANQGVFDNFSCQWDRHLSLNVPQVMIHVDSSFDWREQNYDRISNYRSTVLFLTVVFPWSKFRQAKICVRN